jgi:membrane protein DedA with SNARE-associated domain
MFDSFLSYGYLGLFAFIVLTGFGLPLPEELAVVTAGVMAARGQLDTTAALLLCMVAALLGDSAVYALGAFARRHAGERVRWWFPRVSEERFRQTHALLHRHGFKVLILARFLVGVRFPFYLAIGASRMSFVRFLVVDSICVAAVVGTFFAVSYVLGERYGDVLFDKIHRGHIVATVVIVTTGIILFFAHRWNVARKDREARNAARAPTGQ